MYAFTFEVAGSFLLRFILHRIPLTYKRYIVPLLLASFLSFGEILQPYRI